MSAHDENRIVDGPVSMRRLGLYDWETEPRAAGRWFVSVKVERVLFSERYSDLSGRAVVDDFGDLVLVGALQ